VRPTYKLDISVSTPFFILFPERSGSTHLVNLLNSHPEIDCKHEVFNFKIWPGTTERVVKYPSREERRHALVELYQNSTKAASGFKFKYPKQIQEYEDVFDFLHKNSERVKVIFLYRKNRLKTAISKQNLNRLIDQNKPHFMTDRTFKEIGKLHLNLEKAKNYIDKREKEDALFLQKTEEFPHRYILPYEALIQNEKKILKEVFQFLGVDSAFKAHSPLRKITPDKLQDALSNYADVKEAFANTKYEEYL
jgi:LPS sulfotransferase NodH